jgi:hypothetical protein
MSSFGVMDNFLLRSKLSHCAKVEEFLKKNAQELAERARNGQVQNVLLEMKQ